MTRRFLISITLAAVMSGLIGGAPLLAQRSFTDAGFAVPFSATGTNNGGTADVVGTFTIARFANQNGQLVAIGSVAATVKDAAGAARTVVTNVALPVAAITSGAAGSPTITPQVTCGILHLELGPLDLDLLGLVVHLDRVVLDVAAESGPGNLLGNLLCGISNLLNSGPLPGILDQLVGFLNGVIAAL